MKLREKFKRFWTMDVHNHEGFTLVELIIVIAILAILSGVAVAGYSAYIKKANIQADKTMIAEIENVLLLAYYNGDIDANEQGRIILTTERATVSPADSRLVSVLEDAYGTNWPDVLKLKYSEWDLSTVANSTLMGYIQNSNFATGNMDNLLNSVQYITDQFNGFVAGGGFTPSEEFQAYLDRLNIDITDAQAVSNATVLFVGSLFANTEASDQDIANAWLSDDYSEIVGEDELTSYSAQYAKVLALATYVEKDANVEDGLYTNRLNSAEGTAVISVMNDVYADILSEQEPLVMEYYDWDNIDEDNNISSNSQAYKDAMAFQAYMSGMTSASDSLLDSTDISSDNYFADGNVLNYVENYLQISEGLGDASNGVAIFIFNGVVTHIGEAK